MSADSTPKLSRRKFLQRSAVGLGALAGIDAFLIEPSWVELKTVDVPIKGLGKDLDGYRIAQVSDIHYPRNISTSYVQDAIKLVQTTHPDLLVITGDFVDEKGGPTVPNMREIFQGATALDGILGVLGNHDHWFDAPAVYRELAQNTPVEIIESRHKLIIRGNAALAVGGIGDLWHGPIDPEATFQGVAPEVPRILLSHNPDYAEEMQLPIRIDLQLSGHTHGGEFRIPFGPALVLPTRYGNKFREGLVEGKSHQVYINRGICSVRRARFFCRPEVTCITLRSA